MTAVEIATGIIDKLQEENRVCLETLHKAQDTIKYSERQIAEKDRLIKVLEERLRTGTDGLLEMTNRQKDLTIKHLELQIQKLLKENEDLEVRIEAVKAEICPRCETKLLLIESNEKKRTACKPVKGSSSVLFEKKSETFNPNRLKALQKIVEHKDKRIMHLSKEVQRLTKLEKELTQKVYRLTKLLPLSRLPPESVTECLLKEIQLLEAQKQGSESNCDQFQLYDYLNKTKKDNPFSTGRSVSKPYISKSADGLKKSAAANVKMSTASVTRSEPQDTLDSIKVENEVLFRKLQKLCQDINELKRLFSFESEKLSHGLNSAAKDYDLFKVNLEEIIDNLNDIVQNILGIDFNIQQTILKDSSHSSDKQFVISCLQERLKESLGIVTEYENENKALKENLDKLKAELAQQCTCCLHRKSNNEMFTGDSLQVQNINDVNKLREIIKSKDSQLDSLAVNHISSCQKFIEDFKKNRKHSSFETVQCTSVNSEEEKRLNSLENQNKTLQKQLEVAEKNIKTCETVIENLQKSVRNLEDENVRIETELHKFKSRAVSEASDQPNFSLYTKMSSSVTEIDKLEKLNRELQNKIKILEDTNSKLEAKTISLQAAEQEKSLLKTNLEVSEKQICSLEQSIESLQEKLNTAEIEKSKLQADLNDINLKRNLADAYHDDVMALKTELFLKEDEIKQLKESLESLENKAVEVNYHRRSLHKEIEKFCKLLMENDDMEDNERRKAIYKAAVLHSAQALLRLDDNYNLKPEDSSTNIALEEMKYQSEVYLTEVARINELITIKEQKRDELLKEYLDLPDAEILRPSSSSQHVCHLEVPPVYDNLQSSSDVESLKSGDHPRRKISRSAQKTPKLHVSLETAAELKSLQEELAATKAVTTYLLSSCTRLEDLLSRERTERAKCEIEVQMCQETVKDLRAQLSMKHDMAKRLNTLIEMMRTKECNDEITLEQLKSEMQWLVEENQKVFEKVTATQSELCLCKEENCRIQNALDCVKRQLLHEKYENTKISNELKHLKLQMSSTRSPMREVN